MRTATTATQADAGGCPVPVAPPAGRHPHRLHRPHVPRPHLLSLPRRRRRSRVEARAAADRRGYFLRRLLLLGDLGALCAAFAVAAQAQVALGRQPASPQDLALILAFIPLWMLLGLGAHLYHPRSRGEMVGVADELGPVFRVSTAWCWFVLLGRAALEPGYVELLPTTVLWAASIPSVLLFRAAARAAARRQPWYEQRVLVVGDGPDRARVVQRVMRHPEWGIRLVGVADLVPEDAPLLDLIEARRAQRVIFASHPGALEERSRLTRAVSAAGVQVDLVPGDAEVVGPRTHLHQLEGLPLVSLPPGSPPRSLAMVKRCLDLALAVALLVVTAPLLAYSALRIKLDSPGPVLYRQERVGMNGRRFQLLKLRSMRAGADRGRAQVAALSLHGNGIDSGIFKAREDPRVTRVGAWLRRWSIDELPQLWNVVRGEMSIVGPRPLPVDEDARIGGEFAARYMVRPGITGPWQVMGRSHIPLEDMVRLDHTYVMSWSPAEDAKLIFRTAAAVLHGRGAY